MHAERYVERLVYTAHYPLEMTKVSATFSSIESCVVCFMCDQSGSYSVVSLQAMGIFSPSKNTTFNRRLHAIISERIKMPCCYLHPPPTKTPGRMPRRLASASSTSTSAPLPPRLHRPHLTTLWSRSMPSTPPWRPFAPCSAKAPDRPTHLSVSTAVGGPRAY